MELRSEEKIPTNQNHNMGEKNVPLMFHKVVSRKLPKSTQKRYVYIIKFCEKKEPRKNSEKKGTMQRALQKNQSSFKRKV